MSYVPEHAFDASLRMEAACRPRFELDRALLLDPDAFDDGLRRILGCAREAVLASGGEAARVALELSDSDQAARETSYARHVLRHRPTTAALRGPALLHCDAEMIVVGLPEALPHAARGAVARIWSEGVPGDGWIRLTRGSVDGVDDGTGEPDRVKAYTRWALDRGCAEAWCGPVPSWYEGERHVVVELAPNPTGFTHAMLIANEGSGRIVVRLPADGPRRRESHMLASGWSYSRPDRGGNGMYDSDFPQGAPAMRTTVRLPDPDLFALCAARTWTPSLADAAWLCGRPERLAVLSP